MKRRLLLHINILLTISSLIAQPVQIDWQETIGGDQEDFLRVLKPLSDGNYIAAGFSNSGVSGDKTLPSYGDDDYWLVKLDLTGNILWQRVYGGDSLDRLFGIEELSDGGFILGGYSTSGVSGDKTTPNFGVRDYWVIRTDAAGAIIWQTSLGGSIDDRLYGVKQTSDGGFIAGGWSLSDISGNKTENSNGLNDYWVVKLDSSGDIVWQNTIGGSESDFLWDFEITPDDGVILTGGSDSGISGDKSEPVSGLDDIWLVRLDANGAILWEETIGGDSADSGWSIINSSQGGYVLGGRSASGISGDKTEQNYGVYDYWVMKLDDIGNIEWQNTIGSNLNDQIQARNTLKETLDGGYIVGGHSDSDAGADKSEDSRGLEDYWLVKLDANGSVQWEKTIGGDDRDLVRSVLQKPDGNYLVAGRSRSDATGDKTENSIGLFDFWIIELSPTLNIIDQQLSDALLVYPNPAYEELFFKAEDFQINRVKILSTDGRVLKEIESPDNKISLAGLSGGTYLVEFISGDKASVKKIVKN